MVTGLLEATPGQAGGRELPRSPTVVGNSTWLPSWSNYFRHTKSTLKFSAVLAVSSSQNPSAKSKSTTTETELSSIFSRRSGTIPFSFSNTAKDSCTPDSCSMRGVVSWTRTSKELTLTVSKLQYVPPTASPQVLRVIPLKDGLLIVLGPAAAATDGLPYGTRSPTSANGSDESTSTASTSESASETGT